MATRVVEKTEGGDIQRRARQEIQSGLLRCDRELLEHNLDDSGGYI